MKTRIIKNVRLLKTRVLKMCNRCCIVLFSDPLIRSARFFFVTVPLVARAKKGRFKYARLKKGRFYDALAKTRIIKTLILKTRFLKTRVLLIHACVHKTSGVWIKTRVSFKNTRF
jgi:hypothetical protein